MQEPHESHLPEDLNEVARWLRAGRRQATALELDRLKLRAMHQATDTPRKRGQFMKSRLATLLTMGLLVLGAGGTFAIAKHDEGNGGNDHPSAGKVQYCDENEGENERGSDEGCKPGKGCGDKNHEHGRDDQCKKNEQGDGDGKGKGNDGDADD